MTLPSKVYDFLKWLCLIAMPALSVLIAVIFKAWDIPYSIQVTTTINAIAVFIGSLIGVSHMNYTKETEE